MLNIGLIGKAASIETLIEALKKYPDIIIQGKSSVGMKNQPSEYSFSVHEYNRVELIERSDAIFLEDSSLIPFTLIKDSIKRRKNIFFTGYPNFDEHQSRELIKLVDEAGTIVQVRNPLFFHPHIQYMVKHISHPFYLNIDIVEPAEERGVQIYWDITLLLIKLGQDLPKKVKTLGIGPMETGYNFRNIRIEYPDSSILELCISTGLSKKFEMKAVAGNSIFETDLISGQMKDKSGPVNVSSPDMIKEYESFFKSIIKRQIPATGLPEYLSALKTVSEISGKVTTGTI